MISYDAIDPKMWLELQFIIDSALRFGFHFRNDNWFDIVITNVLCNWQKAFVSAMWLSFVFQSYDTIDSTLWLTFQFITDVRLLILHRD